MLSFEEFQAVNKRDKIKSTTKPTSKPSAGPAKTAVELNPDGLPGIKSGPKPDGTSSQPAPSPAKGVSLWQRIGEVLELHSFQFFIICLVVFDTFCAFLEVCLSDNNLTRTYETQIKTMKIVSTAINVVFSLEILCVYLAFGMRTMGHIGYLTDFLVVGSQVYLETKGVGCESKLSNFLRLWRVARLFAANIALEKESQQAIENQVAILEDRLRNLEIEKETVGVELLKEKEARVSVEALLQNYKEEVDTLNEALKIAAMDIAEVAQDEDGGGLSSDDGGDDDGDEDTGTMHSVRSGRSNKITDGLRARLQDDDRYQHNNHITSTFVVHEDGKFDVK